MDKYITRDKLADFVEKMWDAGVRVELTPKDSAITTYDPSFNSERIYVFDKRGYDALVSEVIENAKPKYQE